MTITEVPLQTRKVGNQNVTFFSKGDHCSRREYASLGMMDSKDVREATSFLKLPLLEKGDKYFQVRVDKFKVMDTLSRVTLSKLFLLHSEKVLL